MQISVPFYLLRQQSFYILLLLIPWSDGGETHMDQKKRDSGMFDMYHEPTLEYEQYRRRIKKNIKKFWQIFLLELNEIQEPVERFSPDLTIRIIGIIEIGKELRRALLSDLERLQMSDGFATWREKEAAELSELMQLRLHYLQNPNDCNLAPKVGIHLYGFTGFAEALHIFVQRFIIAYATERTLIVRSKGWCYTINNDWGDVLSPFSETCTLINGSSYAYWPSSNQTQVMFLPPFDPVQPAASFFPCTLPFDLAPRLARLHGNPFAWWVGQFLKYILRPRNYMAKMMEEIAETRGFERPFVGVHIRRSDSILKTKFVPIEEYMAEVDEYYEMLEVTEEVPVRRIYLATDDPNIISSVEEKYQDRYQIFSNSVIAQSADFYHRCNHLSLMGVTVDIFFLSLADYLVCTFSSNLCRAAYEIMQVFHPDASDKAYSLDRQYFYEFELFENFISVYPHYSKNPREINFNVGEEIQDVVDLKNGYSTGVNKRSKQKGMYPSFKVDELQRTCYFPTYPEINVKKRKK